MFLVFSIVLFLNNPVFAQARGGQGGGGADVPTPEFLLGQIMSFRSHIDEKDSLGETPLIYATKLGEFEVVNLLLDKQADGKITDNEGKKAIDYMEPPNEYSETYYIRTYWRLHFACR